MIVKDYENPAKFDELNNYYEKKALELINSNNKHFSYYDLYQIAERGLENEAHINRNSIIYRILTFYALKFFPKNQLDNPQKYHLPYINHAELGKRVKLIRTDEEDIQFKLLIGSKFDLAKETLQNRQFGTLYSDLYTGKTNGRCHEICLKYQFVGYNIVTAYIPSVFTDLFYLHTYQENDNTVLDLSSNLIFNKDFFYSFLTPEIVSSISPEEFEEDFNKHNGINGSLKNYLVNFPKTKM